MIFSEPSAAPDGFFVNKTNVNRTALYALLLALIFPLVAYFIVKKVSEKAVQLPPRFYPDSVLRKKEKGKIITDTLWHRLPEISFTNQLGQQVSWKNMMKDDSMGKIIVANFFFTHCPTICPTLTANMKKLQESLKAAEKVGDRTADYVQLLSFSVDPERDSVPELKKWADRFQVNPLNWWLLTGDKEQIYDLCINEMKLGLVDGQGVDTAFIHTDRFVLIDRDRVIRGYYRGLDDESLARLSEDIVLLSLEKDKKKKSFLAGKLELIGVIYLLTLAGLGIFLFFLRKARNK
jgi:protein SCO1/2